MREAARLIVDFVEGSDYQNFAGSKMLQSAVERQMDILGEAARHVSIGFQSANPGIPWRSMIGLGNILAHEYGEVRADRIWLIATQEIHPLIGWLDQLLSSRGLE